MNDQATGVTRNTPAIEVVEVSKRYKSVAALDGVSLQIPAGVIFGLVGPNGAGKTTLVRSIVGAVVPDSGEIQVFGRSPIEDKREVRSNVGYMPQESVVYTDMTARENIRFFLSGHKAADAESATEAAIDFADLGAVADRRVGTLSGGIRQRVSLAAAVAHGPPVLLLDEPTAGVDPELRHAFWQHFKQLAAAGTSLVVTTHQMDEVAHCDFIAVMHRGKTIAIAKPEELLGSGARVAITRNGHRTETTVTDVEHGLPAELRAFGLDDGVERIEVGFRGLEEVVLELVRTHEASRMA